MSSTNDSKGATPSTPAREERAPAAQGATAPIPNATTGSADSSTAGARGKASETNAGAANKGKSTASDVADQAKSATSSAAAAVGNKTRDVAAAAGEEIEKGKNESVHQAHRLAEKGRSGLSEVADQAKTAASSAAAAVSDKAQYVVSGASDELVHVIEERKDEGAERLHRVADAIVRASSELQEDLPLVASYVKRGASKIDALAETIKERDGRTLSAEAGDFVRRHPGAIAGLLGLVGFATVRFLMATPPQSGARDRNQDDGGPDTSDAASMTQALRSAATSKGTASGDPGSTSPEAPGFEKTSGTGGATRATS